MRPIRQATLWIVLSAVTAVGCSERVETAENTGERRTRTATPVSMPNAASATKPGEGEASSATAAVRRSFADGETAYRARQYRDATAIFEDHVKQRPEHAMGHYMLGLSAWKANDLPKAAKAFEAALARDPVHLRSLVNLSRVLIDQKQYDEAVTRLMRATEIEPGSNETQRLLGRAYYGQGKTMAAEDAYHRAIDLDDRDVWSMNNLGLLLLEQQRAEEALPLLTRAVELAKHVPAFHNNLGMALEHSGRVEEAIASYRAALAADPTYERAKQNLARLEAVMGHC